MVHSVRRLKVSPSVSQLINAANTGIDAMMIVVLATVVSLTDITNNKALSAAKTA